jgi:hypothetical protein
MIAAFTISKMIAAFSDLGCGTDVLERTFIPVGIGKFLQYVELKFKL